MRRFEELSVGLAELDVVLSLIESRKTPQFDDRIRKQRVAYANYSPIGLAARDGGLMQRKVGSFGIITPTSKTGAINRSHDPAWLTKEDRDTEGVPSVGSSKFSIKVYCHRDQVIV